jgi:hypothetical protein
MMMAHGSIFNLKNKGSLLLLTLKKTNPFLLKQKSVKQQSVLDKAIHLIKTNYIL